MNTTKTAKLLLLTLLILGFSVNAVFAAPSLTGAEIEPPPDPICPEGALLWQQTIDLNNLIGPNGVPAVSEVRFVNLPGYPTSYVIPGPLPAAFGDAISVSVTDAVGWDGYLTRPTSDPAEQQDERFQVVFLLSGVVQWATDFTGDLDDEVLSASWRGSLGSAMLPNGADTIMLLHWAEENPTDDNPNSLVPSSICIEFEPPPPPPPGTGTPGYWMNHPDAWPVDEIEIGGVTYTKEEAIALMKAPVKGNKWNTMFPALVAAKLNVLAGNDDSCIAGTIADADAWMVGKTMVKGKSAAWKVGEPLYKMLDKYNNGELACAVSRDALE